MAWYFAHPAWALALCALASLSPMLLAWLQVRKRSPFAQAPRFMLCCFTLNMIYVVWTGLGMYLPTVTLSLWLGPALMNMGVMEPTTGTMLQALLDANHLLSLLLIPTSSAALGWYVIPHGARCWPGLLLIWNPSPPR